MPARRVEGRLERTHACMLTALLLLPEDVLCTHCLTGTQVVVADDADGTRGEQGDSVTELDELTLLMADTPMRKLRRREKDAEKAFQVRVCGGQQRGCIRFAVGPG